MANRPISSPFALPWLDNQSCSHHFQQIVDPLLVEDQLISNSYLAELHLTFSQVDFSSADSRSGRKGISSIRLILLEDQPREPRLQLHIERLAFRCVCCMDDQFFATTSSSVFLDLTA